MPEKRIVKIYLLLMCCIALTQQCPASTLYWNGTTTTGTGPLVGGDGNWDNVNNNWSNSAGTSPAVWGGDSAVFTATSGTVTLTDNIVYQNMQFSIATPGTYLITSTGGNVLQPLPSATFISDSGISTEIHADIDGTVTPGDLYKQGLGSLTLSGTTTMVGASNFIIDGGTLNVSGTIKGFNSFQIGNTTSGNTLFITGTISNAMNAAIGIPVGVTNNTATVTGNAASWAIGQDLNVGFFGDHSTLSILNGATVTAAASTKIGGDVASTNNILNVTGNGSKLTTTGLMGVGFSGSSNTVNISQGGVVSNKQTYVGLNSTSNGNIVNVKDPGSQLNTSQFFYLGNIGNNNVLNISNAGQVTTTGDMLFSIDPASTGNMATVTDSGSQLIVHGNFRVGAIGGGDMLTISNGGQVLVNTQDAVLGHTAGTSNGNSLIITGPGSRFDVTAGGGGKSLLIGENSSNNSMVISNGGVATASLDGRVGRNAGANNNIATVTDPGSKWIVGGQIRVGTTGFQNTLNVLNGGLVRAGTKFGVGINASALNNVVLVSGVGSSIAAQELDIGVSGTASVTVTDGGTIIATPNGIVISSLAGSGILKIGTGGAPGIVNATKILGGLGAATVEFNHNAPAYAFGAPLTGLLTVNHIGPGTTIFTQPSFYFGTTTISQGTFQGGAAGAFSPVSAFDVQTAGALNLGGFNQIVGSLTNDGLVTFGGASAGVILLDDGPFVQGNSGTYQTKINLAGQSDLMIAAQTATLAGTLSVVATDSYALFENYHLIHANNGVFNQFTNVVANNPLIIGHVIYLTNDVYIEFTPNLVIAGETHNQRNVATQLDTITNPTSDEVLVLNTLINLPIDQLREALDAMAGEQYSYLLQLDRFSNEQFNRSIFNSVRSFVSPCWCLDPCKTKQGWFEIEGGRNFADGDRNSKGLKAKYWGVALGGTLTQCGGFLAGAAGNYQYNHVQFNQGGHTNWNTCKGSLYGAYQNSKGYVFADLILGGSFGRFQRNIDFGSIHRKAKSNPSSFQGAINTEIGVNVEFCSVLFQPFIAAEFGYYNRFKISEKGACSLNLDIRKKSMGTIDTYLGTHFTASCGCIALNADIAWQHCFNKLAGNTINEFDDFGSGFSIFGAHLGHDAIRGAFEVSGNLCDSINVYAEFSGEHWKHWSAYSVALGFNTWW